MHGAERLAFKLACDVIGPRCVRIDDSQKAYRLSLQFQFLVDSGMIASENAYAHDSYGDRIVRWQKVLASPVAGHEIVTVNDQKGICEPPRNELRPMNLERKLPVP